MEIKSLDPAGIAFLIREEGIRLKPYLDIVGVPTIGVGSTFYPNGKRVTMQDPPITTDQAITLFKTTLKHYETTVWSVTRDDINQSNFNALVSFTYNVGSNAFKTSTLLKRVNAKASQALITEAWLRWIKPKALIGRRKREIALYFS